MTNRTGDNKLFIWEGTLVGITTGFVEVYAAAYCLLLKASILQIALLSSLPLLISSFAQLRAPHLLEKIGSRKKIFEFGIVAHALLSFAMAFAFFLGEWGTWFLIAGFCFFSITGQILQPAWLSWIGDTIPNNTQGEFFGERTRLNHIAIFLSTLIGGTFLSWMKKRGFPDIGFCILYLIGGGARLACLPLIHQIHEPIFTGAHKEKILTLASFIKNIFKHHFGLFVIYAGLINLALSMNHPFIAPYLLEHLKINYFNYGLLFATLVVGKFSFYPLWGKWTDTYPAKKILAISGLLFAFSPLLWLFSQNLLYLLCVQGYRGAVWSGFEIASLKLLLDSTSVANRTRYISYYTVFNGILGVVGSMGGSLLITLPWLIPSYFQVFLAAGILQLLFTIFVIPKLGSSKKGN